jgi:Protein of unknown function (DUF2889).
MPLSSAAVDRSRLHVRAVTYEGYRRGDDLFDIEGHLTDVKDHDYRSSPACAAPASRCTTCGYA